LIKKIESKKSNQKNLDLTFTRIFFDFYDFFIYCLELASKQVVIFNFKEFVLM